MMIQALLFNRSHYLGVSQYSDLGPSRSACLQRQKPAMFAQMPLFVYRHFTGAVCRTSSPAFSLASWRSNSSDMVRSPTSRSRPRRGSPVAPTRFKVLIYLKRFGAGACLASTSKSLAQINKSLDGD